MCRIRLCINVIYLRLRSTGFELNKPEFTRTVITS